MKPQAIPNYQQQIAAAMARGDVSEVARVAHSAVQAHPRHGFFHKALGVGLMLQGESDAAAGALREAALISPQDGEVFANLGTVLHRLRDYDDARAAFTEALRLQPNNPVFLTNYGSLLADQGDLDAALAAHERALSLQPAFAEAHHNRATALACLPWRLEEALAGFAEAIRLRPSFLPAWDGYLFLLNYHPESSPEQMRAAAVQYGDMLRSSLREDLSPSSNEADPKRPITVGFVSGDLRDHVVGRALSVVLPHLDRGAFRLIAYYAAPAKDALSGKIEAMLDLWRDVANLDDARLAEQIRADRVDLLIDLAGHTRFNRLPLFVRRPAPVQASWLGYYATTGVREIDYFIGDGVVMPQAESTHFVEQPWRLADAYYVMPPPSSAQVRPETPAREVGRITFGCCNSLIKLSEVTLRCWAAVLAAIPDSRLFLKTRELGNASIRDTLQARFAALGVASDRLIMSGWSPREEYLEQLRMVDIALDPFPFPGGATTFDCLALGIPVLTRRGDRFVAHQGETLLRGIGLEAWIAASDEDYVRLAVAFAGDLAVLEHTRGDIAARFATAPIFDGRRLAGQLGDAWRAMWQRWCCSTARTNPGVAWQGHDAP